MGTNNRLPLSSDAADWEFHALRITAFILPKNVREEWLGDLQETLSDMQSLGYGRWTHSLVALAWLGILGVALIRITIGDLLRPRSPDRSLSGSRSVDEQ